MYLYTYDIFVYLTFELGLERSPVSSSVFFFLILYITSVGYFFLYPFSKSSVHVVFLHDYQTDTVLLPFLFVVISFCNVSLSG